MALEAMIFSQDPLISSPSYNYYCSNSNYPTNSNITNNNNFGMNYEFANYYYSPKLLEDNLKLPFNGGLFETNYNQIDNNNFDFSSTNSELINLENIVPQWNDDHYQYIPLNSSSPEENIQYLSSEAPPPNTTATPMVVGGGARRKRRRRSCKNKEEVEQQRMTHIAVERNRRKQMNEYLAVIRSLMPPSYVQRGDQASIVGGAINYVKELEQLLQSMEGQKTPNKHHCHDDHQQPPSPPKVGDGGGGNEGGQKADEACLESEKWPQVLFADFFSFPQYSTRAKQANSDGSGSSNTVSSSNSGVGEIEVTMVENHANVKILAKKQPKQLVKLIAGFQGLRLNVLHINVTTVDSFGLISLSLKVEEGCQLNSVDDIAAATNHILGQVQDQAQII